MDNAHTNEGKTMTLEYAGSIFRSRTDRNAAMIADFVTACGSEVDDEALAYIDDTSTLRSDLLSQEWATADEINEVMDAVSEAREIVCEMLDR